MASLIAFDREYLDHRIAQMGIDQTWRSILKTNLANRPELQYIFRSQAFKGATVLDKDLIKDLSIGEIGVLYEYSHAALDASARKSNGLYFTPDDVATFMASFSSQFPPGIWLDPCSGIGNLSWHLVASQEFPEEFLINNLLVADRDELALLIARTLLTAQFQNKEKRLFQKIRQNFLIFDFLSVADELTLVPSKESLTNIPSHDYVIANPPYLATTANPAFETGDARDLYAYFLENIIKTSRGFISVTPQSFTNAAKFSSLRRLILDHFSDLRIFCFDNIPGNIFKGIKFGSSNSNSANSIRAAIMVARPHKGTPRITGLVRWKSSERYRLFQEVESFASDVPLNEEYFPKVNKPLQNLYIQSRNWKKLGAIVASRETSFQLFVASSPRYFISATKSAMDRSSQHVISFSDEQSRSLAYMAINSSLMYWWWRVRDGGMTLSLETLHSLPIPNFKIQSQLVSRLEESESENRVFKQNAGAPRENVKHPTELIAALNQAICREFAQELLQSHANSDFSHS